MGQDIRGYQNYHIRNTTAGSAVATVIVFPGITERVDIVHENGSPAWIAFDGRTLTPYGNVGSQIFMISGNSLTFPIRTGSIQIIGSAGSPIGASTSTVKVTGWY